MCTVRVCCDGLAVDLTSAVHSGQQLNKSTVDFFSPLGQSQVVETLLIARPNRQAFLHLLPLCPGLSTVTATVV